MWNIHQISLLVSLIISILAAITVFLYCFSLRITKRNVKKSSLAEAHLKSQFDALFNVAFDGLMIVDTTGNITAINHNALKILNINHQAETLTHHVINELIISNPYFINASNNDSFGDIITLNKINVIANRVRIKTNNKLNGWAISFRRYDEFSIRTKELTQTEQHLETLRILHHEHLNWIATISGLLQLKEYQQALDIVMSTSSPQQSLLDQITNVFKSRVIAGLILGKCHQAKQLGLEIVITPGSLLSLRPNPLTDSELTCILGNLLTNAFEAMLKKTAGVNCIELYISDENNEIIIEVSDYGCGIDPLLRDNLFTRGVTSKNNKDHGIGLFLIKNIVDRHRGIITIEDNTPCGTLFSIFIPKTKEMTDEIFKYINY